MTTKKAILQGMTLIALIVLSRLGHWNWEAFIFGAWVDHVFTSCTRCDK